MSTKKEDTGHNGENPRRLPLQSAATSTDLPPPPLRAKNRPAINILRAALSMVRPRSTKKRASRSGENGLLKNIILGVVRPLQRPENEPAPAPLTIAPVEKIAGLHEQPKQACLPPPSPTCSGSQGWLSTDGISPYASAEDLSSLDTSIEDEENRVGAPHDIDRQAEEFIAKFYEQMRQQQINQERGRLL